LWNGRGRSRAYTAKKILPQVLEFGTHVLYLSQQQTPNTMTTMNATTIPTTPTTTLPTLDNLNTYATIDSSNSLYTFRGKPDARYGVRMAPGNKYIWSADGSFRATHHRAVKYYADVTGMSYAEAFAACKAAHAAYQDQQRQRQAEREQRAQERIAELSARREGMYRVEIPCVKMLANGREVGASHWATVQATSAANAWLKAVNTMPPHLYHEESIERCYIEFLGAPA
jgi:hypothetical protein